MTHIPFAGDDDLHDKIADSYGDLMSSLFLVHNASRSEGRFWASLEYNFGLGMCDVYREYLKEVDPT